MTDTINSAIDFFEKIKAEDEVTIKFRKVNGAERTMRCTLDFSKIPRNKHPKDVNMAKILKNLMNHGHIHVFDLDKQEWRTVPYDRSEWIEAPGNPRMRIKR